MQIVVVSLFYLPVFNSKISIFAFAQADHKYGITISLTARQLALIAKENLEMMNKYLAAQKDTPVKAAESEGKQSPTAPSVAPAQ